MKELINWHELSRRLSGNGQNIRPNKIPKKYQKKLLVCSKFSKPGSVGKIGHNVRGLCVRCLCALARVSASNDAKPVLCSRCGSFSINFNRSGVLIFFCALG